MGIFKSTKKAASKIVDVRVDRWMSLDYLADTTSRFKYLLIDLVVPKKAQYSETFEEALKRLNLTEEDIKQRKKEFTQLFYFFIFLALTIIIYALYVAFQGNILSTFIAFCLSLFCLTQAFRFHFWLFQIKQRKLGCTWREWLNSEIVLQDESNHENQMRVSKTQSTIASQDKTEG